MLHVSTIKPLDQDAIGSFCGSYDVVNTLENHSRTGSLGTAAAEVLAESGSRTRLRRLEVPDAWADRWTTSAASSVSTPSAHAPSRTVRHGGSTAQGGAGVMVRPPAPTASRSRSSAHSLG